LFVLKVYFKICHCSGWWFARCYHEDDAAETTGYVPASYLTKDDVKLGKSFSPLAMVSS